jgi:hypothetical protein
MTNYGVLIAYLKGVFPRALEPFPEAAALLQAAARPGRPSPRRPGGPAEM